MNARSKLFVQNKRKRHAMTSERKNTAKRDAHSHEPFSVQEIYIDGLSALHLTGTNLRATAFSMQPPPQVNPVAVARLVMTKETAETIVKQLQKALAG
jgi:hypothetical protein